MSRRYLPLLLVLLATGSVSAKMSLPFIENDFDKAMAAAQAQKVPVFVEVWAPW
ncbi:MAG TPA: hypothetical protein VJ826_10730 [Candidatus Polarisedimenticolaceae bacterium]|nr:hypothetical protein [Candidatus Polarisedimenticolaceae bacterium]